MDKHGLIMLCGKQGVAWPEGPSLTSCMCTTDNPEVVTVIDFKSGL